MGHACGEIKMPSHYVMVVFALMSCCVAATGELENIACTFVIFFPIHFSSESSVWKNLGIGMFI